MKKLSKPAIAKSRKCLRVVRVFEEAFEASNRKIKEMLESGMVFEFAQSQQTQNQGNASEWYEFLKKLAKPAIAKSRKCLRVV